MSSRKKTKIIFIFIFLILIVSITGIIISKNNNNNKINIKNTKNAKIFRIKYLVMKKTNDSYSLEDSLTKHFDDFLSFADSYIYLKKEGNYYVANLKNNVNDEIIKNITDYAFANNNNNAEMINDASYNKKTKEIKIPKKYYQDKKNPYPLQMEFLIRMSEIESRKLPINVKQQKLVFKNKKLYKNIIENFVETNITIDKGLNKKNFKVFINNNYLLKKNEYQYNKKSGKLTLNLSPILINNIEVKKESKIKRILSINHISAAATYYGQYKKIKQIIVSSKPTNGTVDLTVQTKGTSSANAKKTYAYGSDDNIEFNTSNFDNITASDFGRTQIDDIIGFTASALNTLKSKTNPFYLTSACVHISTPSGVNAQSVSKDSWPFEYIVKGDENSGYIYFLLDPKQYYWSGVQSTDKVVQTLLTYVKYKKREQKGELLWTKNLDGCDDSDYNYNWKFNLYSRTADNKGNLSMKDTGTDLYSDEDGYIYYSSATARTYYKISEDVADVTIPNTTTKYKNCAVFTEGGEDKIVYNSGRCIKRARKLYGGETVTSTSNRSACKAKANELVFCDDDDTNIVNHCPQQYYAICIRKLWRGIGINSNAQFKFSQGSDSLVVDEGQIGYVSDPARPNTWWVSNEYNTLTCAVGLTSDSGVIIQELSSYPSGESYYGGKAWTTIGNNTAERYIAIKEQSDGSCWFNNDAKPYWAGGLKPYPLTEKETSSGYVYYNSSYQDDDGKRIYDANYNDQYMLAVPYNDPGHGEVDMNNEKVSYCAPILKRDKVSGKKICASNADKGCFYKESARPSQIIKRMSSLKNLNEEHKNSINRGLYCLDRLSHAYRDYMSILDNNYLPSYLREYNNSILDDYKKIIHQDVFDDTKYNVVFEKPYWNQSPSITHFKPRNIIDDYDIEEFLYNFLNEDTYSDCISQAERKYKSIYKECDSQYGTNSSSYQNCKKNNDECKKDARDNIKSCFTGRNGENDFYYKLFKEELDEELDKVYKDKDIDPNEKNDVITDRVGKLTEFLNNYDKNWDKDTRQPIDLTKTNLSALFNFHRTSDGEDHSKDVLISTDPHSGVTYLNNINPEKCDLEHVNGVSPTFEATEIKSPQGWTISDKSPHSLTNLEQNSNYSFCSLRSEDVFSFEDIGLKLNWGKSSYYNNGHDINLKKAQFKVAKVDDNGEVIPNKYIGVEKDLVEVEDDNNGVITKKKCYVANNLDKNENEASILESGNAETKNDGEVCLIGLDEGSYKIIETKPPEYHTFCDIKELTLKASEHFKKLVGQSTNDKERTLFYNCSTNYEFSKSITNEDIITNNQSDSDNTNNTSKQLDYELTKLDFNLVATSAPDTKLSFYDLGDGVYEYKSGYKDLTREKASDEEEHDVVDILHLNKNRKFRVNFLPYNVEYEVKEAEKENCNDVNGNNCSTLGFYLNDEDSNKSVFNIDEYSNNSKEEFSDKFQSSTLETLLAKSSMQNTATEIHFKKEDIYKYYDENTLSDDEKHKNEVLFDTFTFKLYDINNNEVKLEEISPGLYKFNKDDNYVDSDGNTITIKKVNELHTHNGKLTITNLCAGNTYRLEEVSQPAQAAFILPDDHPSITYTISKTKTEMIANKDDEEKIITNKPTRVVVQKKDNKTNEDMKEGKSVKEKARFKVYRCDKTYISKCTYELSNKKPINFTPLGKIEGDLEDPGEDVYRVVPNSHIKNGEKYVNDLNLNENGRLILRYLPSGYKYVIVEENAPDGYFNLDSPLNEVSIEPNPNNTDASGIFTNYATEIKFKKDDIYKYYKKEDLDALKSQTQIFDSMTFVLRDQDGNIVNLYKVQDGVYRFINNDGETNGEETSLHTLNGEMLIRNLYRDETYYIEEIRSDTKGDFILPNNIDNSSLIENRAKAKLGNNHHPIVKYNIPDKISEAAIDGEVPESLTRLIDNLPSRVVFEKRDVKTGELIYDEENQDDMHKEIYTTFNVYRCNPDVVTCTKKNGELIYFEDRERNADLTKDVDPTAIEKDASLGTIRVYKYSKLNSKNNAIKDLHTDRGMLVLSYLPSGYYEPDNEGKSNKDVFKQYKYVLVETVAPNGYYNPTDLENETEFTVIHSSTIDDKNYETLTEKVLNTPTEIHFVKSDFYDYYNAKDLASVKSDEQIFDSMRFVLRDRNGKILKLKCADAYNYKDVKGKECKTGQYRYLPYKSNENTIEELRTQDGKFMISHLYRNETYYIEEVKTDDEGDFILSKDFNYPGLPFENHGHPVVKYVLPENEPPTMESVTREIRNLPTRVVFQKRDLKYGNIISEEVGKEKTTFNIRLCNEDVSLSDCNVNNSKIVYFKDRALLNDKYNLNDIDNGKEVYKYSKLNDSKDAVYNLHPYKGELILRYLPAGYYKDKERKNYVKYNYILVETVAPPKYDLPTNGNEITRFNVVNDTINVDVIEKPNKPTKILIEKTDGETGERIRGTKFKLYKIPNNNGKSVYDPNKALLNQQMNLVKLHTVRDGEYEENTDLAVLDTNIFTTCSNNCSDISKDLWSTFSNSRYSDDQLSKEEDEVIVKQGQAIIQYLDINTYYVIEEVEAPEGYRLPEKREDRLKLVYIPESDENVYVKTSQANLENYFQFYKFDEYNNLLDGAKFKLQKLDDNKKYHDVDIVFDEERSKQKNMQIYRMLDTKYSETLDKDYITLIDENEDKDKDKTTEDKKNIITTKDGTAVIYRLAEGQYRILEVEAAPGKELPKKTINVATFFVDSDGKVYGSSIITNKKPTIPNVVRPSANAELQVDVQTGKLRVRYSIIIAIVITIIGILFYRLYRKKVKK